jgi:hypothetical protein
VIEPKYVDIAIKRIEEAKESQALFAGLDEPPEPEPDPELF